MPRKRAQGLSGKRAGGPAGTQVSGTLLPSASDAALAVDGRSPMTGRENRAPHGWRMSVTIEDIAVLGALLLFGTVSLAVIVLMFP
jgi:hypothetical protein